jgi:predicted nucleic acid-binding protein
MYVFDTNILSEVMKAEPHPSVAAWLRACPADAMFTTAISRSEILYGIRRLPDGAKRQRLERAAQVMFAQEFQTRILPFDVQATDIYTDLRIARAQSGRPLTAEDGMIAAIAKAHGATVVTRDVGGFDGCGVILINPWESGGGAGTEEIRAP